MDSKKISITNFQKILKAYGLKIVVKTYANGWVTVKNLVYDHQDTSYTCGPSSLKMELSDYGLSLNEMALASYSSSNSNVGTTHSGLINAVKKVNSIYGTKFSAWDSNFSSVGSGRTLQVHIDQSSSYTSYKVIFKPKYLRTLRCACGVEYEFWTCKTG